MGKAEVHDGKVLTCVARARSLAARSSAAMSLKSTRYVFFSHLYPRSSCDWRGRDYWYGWHAWPGLAGGLLW
jgi:hypothetical protein